MALTDAPTSPSICLAWVWDNSSDRAIFCVSANVSSCPFPRSFCQSSVDLHLSIIWSRICSFFVAPNSQFAAWLVSLTINWSTVSCPSCFIWQKMCRSYGTFTCGVKYASSVWSAALYTSSSSPSGAPGSIRVSKISWTSIPAQCKSNAFLQAAAVIPWPST